MKYIILIGYSHINCLFSELTDSYSSDYLVKRIHLTTLFNNEKLKDSKSPLSELVVKKLQEILDSFPANIKQKNINIILVLGSNSHHIIGLVKTNPPYDFIHPDYQGLKIDETTEFVPYNAVRTVLQSSISFCEKIIKEIKKENPRNNILHLGLPPPPLDETKVLESITAYFTHDNENPEIAHPNLRYKLWRLYTDMFDELCKKYKLPFIHVPSETMDKEMFLKPEGIENATHANRWYAKHYINKLKPFLR